MATISSCDSDTLAVVKKSLRELLKPWEMLCGLTDIGGAFVPDIWCKTPESYERHIGDYMNAPTPIINARTGAIKFADWDDEEVNEAIEKGRYIKLQDKPKYAEEQ